MHAVALVILLRQPSTHLTWECRTCVKVLSSSVRSVYAARICHPCWDEMTLLRLQGFWCLFLSQQCDFSAARWQGTLKCFTAFCRVSLSLSFQWAGILCHPEQFVYGIYVSLYERHVLMSFALYTSAFCVPCSHVRYSSVDRNLWNSPVCFHDKNKAFIPAPFN